MRKKALFYFLCFLSSVFGTMVVVIDSIASTYVEDIWVYGNLSFVLGTVLSFIIALVFMIPVRGRPLGKNADPNFYGIFIPNREHLKYFLPMALGNAIATIGYFYVIATMLDPSAVLPFMQLVILYLALGEIIIEGDTPSLLEIQSLTMIMFGALLASISPTGTLNIHSLIVVMAVINTGATLKIVAQRRMRLIRIDGKRIDSINIRIWNLFFSTIFFIVIIGVMDPKSIIEMFHASSKLILITALSMTITFFSKITYIRALGIGRASITQAATSITVILGIPATLLINYLMPGVLSEIFVSPVVLTIKLIGTIMVSLGVITLALSEVRAYILIRAPRGKGSTILRNISRIRGIVLVSALAGKYDYIAKVKLRTLGKAYRYIVRELEKIEGIEDFVWLSTLYEWEEI